MSGNTGRVKIGIFHQKFELGDEKIRPIVDKALANGFYFAVTPLKSDDHLEDQNEIDLSFVHDFELASKDWRSHTQGLLLWTGDGEQRSEALLERQMLYANHLGVSILYLDCTHFDRTQLARFSRVINSHLMPTWASSVQPEIRVILDINDVSHAEMNGTPILNGDAQMNGNADSSDIFTSWDKCSLIRSLVHPDSRLGVALLLSGDLPDEEDLKLWLGERILALIIPTSAFISNDQGYPVLTKSYQNFIRRCIFHQAIRLDLIVKPVDGCKSSLHLYFQYLEHLRGLHCRLDDSLEFIRGYEDVLQIPLQPLKDNLESSTYAVFEHDPIKYLAYQEAVTQALKDKKENQIDGTQTFVVMVLGAGRGPLVTASLKAAVDVCVDIKVIVVEKNPHAVTTLRHMKEKRPDWCKQDITIYGCDMRDLLTVEKADIVVSELLGSLADNELSPECLSKIVSYMKPNGVCIPQKYNSYIHPIMSHRLFSDTIYTGSRPIASIRQSASTFSWSHAYTTDSGYVVSLRNFYAIDEPQLLFTFEHLSPQDEEKANKGKRLTESEKSYRFAELTFTAKRKCTMHGFGGYFDTTLYGTVKLSTHPAEHTPGMHSWFPFWIPLRDQVSLKAGDKITVDFWRLRDARQVWYEWCLTEPVNTRIQNCNGQSNSISLF